MIAGMALLFLWILAFESAIVLASDSIPGLNGKVFIAVASAVAGTIMGLILLNLPDEDE